jgi:hypothetical protein
MEYIDKLAEQAVKEAIEALLARAERPCSHNVPLEAQRLLMDKGRGRVAQSIAEKKVVDAIWRMKERKDIKAPTSPHGDWVIVDRRPSAAAGSHSA